MSVQAPGRCVCASAVGTRTVSPFCPVVPLNAAIWGNVGALSQVIKPETCPRGSGQACCDFRGQISASQLLAAIRGRSIDAPAINFPFLGRHLLPDEFSHRFRHRNLSPDARSTVRRVALARGLNTRRFAFRNKRRFRSCRQQSYAQRRPGFETHWRDAAGQDRDREQRRISAESIRAGEDPRWPRKNWRLQAELGS